MKLNWLVFGYMVENNGQLTSDRASVRYRVCIPHFHLLSRGIDSEIIHIELNDTVDDVLKKINGDIIIVNKPFREMSHTITGLINELRKIPAKIIADFCDNHFEHSELGPIYRDLAGLSTSLVTNTEYMADVVKKYTNMDSYVITDPYEGPEGNVNFSPKERFKLLWFGHNTNLNTLDNFFPQLFQVSQVIPLDVHIVTGVMNGIEDLCNQFNLEHHEYCSLRYTPWSVNTTWEALSETDAVVIPSLPTKMKIVKSPNRLVETLRAGRFALAHPLPSYAQFEEYAWINDDLPSGILWSLDNKQEVTKRVQMGQDYVFREFSPEKIGDDWLSVIHRANDSRPDQDNMEV